jgi:hypothetical protein
VIETYVPLSIGLLRRMNPLIVAVLRSKTLHYTSRPLAEL